MVDFGVDFEVGFGVDFGVGFEVGFRVGFEVDFGVGFEVDSGFVGVPLPGVASRCEADGVAFLSLG